MTKPIFTGPNWNKGSIMRMLEECEKIGREELKLTWYDNNLEIVDYATMLDIYSSHGMPVMYDHWSFGKSYVQNYNNYKNGRMGLALEMVINTNPCINYLLDENEAVEQCMVIAHAAIGHNSFFKNNYLFKQWTQADSIIDYLLFAKKYVAQCEEKYGFDLVEQTLDVAHSLMWNGVDRYIKPKILSAVEELNRQKDREKHYELMLDEITKLIPSNKKKKQRKKDKGSEIYLPSGPEENLLYFLEKKSPILKSWQREILRIVRKISQFFYPNINSKNINEGWATTVHHYIMNRLYEKGLIDTSAMSIFHASHASVIYQPTFDSKHFNGFNPYHLGHSIFLDIKRMSKIPTEEDREWFPNIAGGDWLENWHYAYENFRDDSFIQQFLSPKVIRDMKLFAYFDDEDEDEYEIVDIHNERGYRRVRKTLSNEIGMKIPDVQVTGVLFDTRECFLTHFTQDSVLMSDDCIKTLENFKELWGFETYLQTRERETNELIIEYPED